MNLTKQIEKDLIEALKSKNEHMAETLRMLKATIHNFQIAQKKEEISDEDFFSLTQKEIKSRKESIEFYKKGRRPELAEKEKKEIEILQKYLPVQLSEEEIRAIVKTAMQKTNAQSIQDMGKVMGVIMTQTRGKTDGSRVSQIVKEELTS